MKYRRLALGCCLVQALSLLGCSSEDPPSPLVDLPVSESIQGELEHPVDIIRDEFGIPHIYGKSLVDVAYAQGYSMAQDRLVQMDLLRHYAGGTLAELFGALDESFIDRDISLRVHGMRRTAELVWITLRDSADPKDRELAKVLSSFAKGVNLYLSELKNGQRRLNGVFGLAYDPMTTAPWTEVDSISLARLQAFDLTFDAETELARTQTEAAAFRVFDQAGDPKLRARKGLASDLFRQQPLAPAFIQKDATVCEPVPMQVQGSAKQDPPMTRGLGAGDLDSLLHSTEGVGLARRTNEERGSNNWVVAPNRSKSGRALLANDTHLSLDNPAIFYLSHLSTPASTPTSGQGGIENVMGVQFPGIPGVVLGMNDRLAWGSTTTNADVTDLYEEQILSCEGKPCVEWRDPQKGEGPKAKVLLLAREEEIAVGRFGKITERRKVTYFEVPHHGPILPRIGPTHDLLPLGPQEVSVRYTGYRPSFEVRAILTVNRATSTKAGMDAIENDFSVGNQNWIFADVEGHIGWTSHVTLPERPKGARPWVVQPGDGSAEWAKEPVKAERQPRAYDPPCGMIVSANNDPTGATADETMQPAVYHGWDYDVGARAARITTLLASSKDKSLTPEAMAQIQGDHRSFLGERLSPIAIASGKDLLAEIDKPGTHPDLKALALSVPASGKARLGDALARLSAWKFATPAGMAHEGSADEVTESIATSLFNAWLAEFHSRTLGDEFEAVDAAYAPQKIRIAKPHSGFQRKLLVTATLHADRLTVGRQMNGDSLLFDDLRTEGRIETKREIAAASLLAALTNLQTTLGDDPSKWVWGRLHRLILDPLVPVSELRLPHPKDPLFPQGVPRHGDVFSVDASSYGIRYGMPRTQNEFTYGHGAAIRFVAEMTQKGPKAVNVLPGGQVFDPESPHYADQFEMWRQNRAFPLPFTVDEVAQSAKKEAALSRPVRLQLTPKAK